MSVDYGAYPVLCVDDEKPNLVALQYALGERFALITVESGEEALEVLRKQEVAVLLADQRMPGISGVELCERARALRPDAIRIIITAYADLHAAIDAINRGQVTRYITKPFRAESLTEILEAAIELVHMHRTVRELEVRLLGTGQATAVHAMHTQVAHELKNYLFPLTVGFQQLVDLTDSALRVVATDPGRAADMLRGAREIEADAVAALDQIRALVTRLHRGEPLTPTPGVRADAARVVDTTIRILRSELERAAQVEVVLDGSPIVAMDRSTLGQVVMNLLLNAAQAVAERPPGRIEVRVGLDGGRALLTVRDTGPGIEPSIRERIFDPYFTTKREGHGLGLSIVRELVSRAGGELSVQSVPGDGATFAIRLPLARGSGSPSGM